MYGITESVYKKRKRLKKDAFLFIVKCKLT